LNTKLYIYVFISIRKTTLQGLSIGLSTHVSHNYLTFVFNFQYLYEGVHLRQVWEKCPMFVLLGMGRQE